MTSDPHNALIVGPSVLAEPVGSGPLDGLSFVVKDLFDVAGCRTGAGNPEVLVAAEPAASHAPAVAALLGAGARCIGKAHTVETAYGLSGVNDHYGTPENPVDPRRDPGGSSSGSAVAVAGGLCDFALGSDTAGSIRVPASYCGVIGFRPTHGRVSLDGVFPLAPRFDTVGWLARTGDLARRVGEVLLGSATRRAHPGRLAVAVDLFGQCDEGHGETIDETVQHLARSLGLVPEPVRLWDGDERDQWPEVFRTLQRYDAWRANRGWIERLRPAFGPRVAPRWAEAAAVTSEENAAAEALGEALSERAWELLGGDTVLVIPSAPGPAPILADDSEAAGSVRARLMTLSTISPIARLPEVSLPLMRFDGLPVGMGLVASPGNDEMLLDLAAELV